MPDRLPRPALAFRIGITGARDLERRPGAVQAVIRRQVEAVLGAARRHVAAAAQMPELLALHGDAGAPRMRLLTPLAEGADRLAAAVAATLDYEIDVALPFPRAEYARDFADAASLAGFDAWLGGGQAAGGRPYLALDGGRGDAETASYEAVGRLVARNCDLLLAVWDGRPARGRGGTGDIVEFASRAALPVWWIDADGEAAPRLLGDAAERRDPAAAPGGDDAEGPLAQLVRRTLLPSRPFCRSGDAARRITGGLLAPAHDAAPALPAAYWDALFQPADRAARAFADDGRSSALRLCLAAGLAAAFGALGLAGTSWDGAAAAAELILLAAILTALAVDERRDRAERRDGCRFLAELCRAQAVLAALGWTLPLPHLRRTAPAGSGALRSPASPAEVWAAWYFAAAVRASPLPRGDLHEPRLEQARASARLWFADERRDRHGDRHGPGRRLAPRFGSPNTRILLAALLLIPPKLILLGIAGEAARIPILLLGVAAAVLPAAAGWLGALQLRAASAPPAGRAPRPPRATAAGGRIDGLDLSRPLASQELAAAILEMIAAALPDLDGPAGPDGAGGREGG